MGIIQRQAISGTIISYIGVAIGFVTTALVFPKVLTKEEIGLLSLLMSYSVIFAQFASLGTGRIAMNTSPYFRNEPRKHHGLLFILLFITGIGFIISVPVYFLIKDYLIKNSSGDSQLLVGNFHYLLPLIFFTLLFMVLDSYYKVLHKAVIGIILKELIQRVLFLVFIILYIYELIDFGQYTLAYVVSICLPAIVLIIWLIKEKEMNLKPDIRNLDKDLRKMIVQVGFYGILTGFSGIVITNIDRIMVERFLDLGSTGIYATTAYFATLIVLPSRALMKISDPIISQSWKNNDLEHLKFLYKKTSMSQLVIGALLFIGIWGNESNIFRILPETYEQGKYVILFIGLAFLSDMACGASSLILANSRYFKYQAFFMFLLILLVVVTNLLFIPIWGMTGAAIATLLSKLLTNLGIFLFLKIKFNLQPYSWKYFSIFIFAAIAYLAGYFLPESSNLYLDIMYRSAVIAVVYLTLLLRFRIFTELNEKFTWVLHKSGFLSEKKGPR